MICILLYILFFILRTAYCVFYIVCFYCILGLLLIFYVYICRILLIQLLGCHSEINACLDKKINKEVNWTKETRSHGHHVHVELIIHKWWYTVLHTPSYIHEPPCITHTHTACHGVYRRHGPHIIKSLNLSHSMIWMKQPLQLIRPLVAHQATLCGTPLTVLDVMRPFSSTVTVSVPFCTTLNNT